MDGKSTPASVDLKLANHPTNASMNSAITSANNATLATVAATYGLKSTQDQQALDIAARQTAADVDQKIATALLDRPTTTDLNSSVALRTTPADVDQKIATALLPLVAQTVLDAALALRPRRARRPWPAAQTGLSLPHTDTAGLNALLAVRDARLDGHDADILALQGAGPFATAAELSASETSLQSAIDALNAALAALTTGGGTNLANAQAWPGQTTWDLLVGTNTIRNWHFQAPLSASLANDNFTLSLACDAYSQAEVDALLAPLASESWVTVQMDAAIAAAVAGIDLSAYVPWTGLQAPILNEIGIALASYYTSSEVDGLIAGASLANAPGWTGNTTWELLVGQAVRNLHLTGPLVATLQNSGNTLQLDCQAYDQSETYTQAEVNTQISNAVDALNLSQYATQADIDSSLSAELASYWDQGQTSAEIASQISGAGFLTEAQGDARFHPVNGNAGGNGIIPMVLDNFTPRMIRALLPQAPLGANLILGNSATVQLTCDCYSKSESDGRYFSDYAPLDARYHVVNGNAGGGGIIPMVLDNFTPRMIRALSASAVGGQPDPRELRHGAADLRLLVEGRERRALRPGGGGALGPAAGQRCEGQRRRLPDAAGRQPRHRVRGLQRRGGRPREPQDGRGRAHQGRHHGTSLGAAGSFQAGTLEPLLPTDQF